MRLNPLAPTHAASLLRELREARGNRCRSAAPSTMKKIIAVERRRDEEAFRHGGAGQARHPKSAMRPVPNAAHGSAFGRA